MLCVCVLCVQEREAAQRAAELATRALAAEKRLVEAMKDEAAASSELLEAERAAKFAAQVRNSFPLLKLCMALDLGLLVHCYPADFRQSGHLQNCRYLMKSSLAFALMFRML